jgi:hypothetical protein
MGSRVAASETKQFRDLDRLSLLFLPMPAVRAIITCKTRKNTQIIDFIIF